MTLTTRLSLFFMLVLAIVLVGFSIVLYFLADRHLHRQAQERLDAVLNVLSAAVDIGPDGLEWEPIDRRIRLDAAAYSEPVSWIIADNQGHLLDQSNSIDSELFASEIAQANFSNVVASGNPRGRWYLGRRWIGTLDELESRAASADDEIRYPKLSITAGVPRDSVRSTLRQLSLSLIILSSAIWVATLFLGRFVCHQALRPVKTMARAASQIQASDASWRLPVITTQDELGELNHAFNSLLDRAQEAFERQRRFTSDASHQLRTPLTAISGQVDVAMRRERNGEEYRRVLSTVQSKVRHLTRIVESLLFLARADAEAIKPVLEKLDLVLWLPKYLETWQDHHRAKDITLQKLNSNSCEISVEPELFRELLDILLDNASKYSPDNTLIQIQLEIHQKDVSIHVVNQGTGIPEYDLANLFVPFVRSDESRLRGNKGIGLGLSIAKRLSGLFSGELSATSQANAETRFTLSLPLTI